MKTKFACKWTVPGIRLMFVFIPISFSVEKIVAPFSTSQINFLEKIKTIYAYF
ncbi:hypothetical protein ACYI5F_003094 [Listeria monocytogenes]